MEIAKHKEVKYIPILGFLCSAYANPIPINVKWNSQGMNHVWYPHWKSDNRI